MTTRLTLHARSPLSEQTSHGLAHLVEMAQRQLSLRKLSLVHTREQLTALDAQIGEFLRDRNSQPPRDAGIFLCRMAVHLRTLADELDGRGAQGERP